MTDWTEPGAFEVAPGVHRIPLPLPMDGLRAVNVYAIDTGDGLTLIDGGWAIEESRTLLEKSLASIDRQVSDITRFLVTHVHRDHYTQAVTVRREFGSHVSLGIGDKPTLDLIHDPDVEEDPYVEVLRTSGAGQMATDWGTYTAEMTPDLTLWEAPDTWLSGDHEIAVGQRTLEAVSTPGHTQGHYVFADHGDGLLFAGDHVLPTITPSIGFEPKLAGQPLGDFLNSLAKVRAMPDLRLLPAHGAVTGSTHARVDELTAHHDVRLDLCREAVAAEPASSYDVAARLPWTRHERKLKDLDLFNSALATLETRAHLELLVARGEMTRTLTDGVHIYAIP
ncbi:MULTISPECIES: MBL fold metallo-hydrolase [unclassified Nocardioides]|uniref:MBL fold metallo-hydrolase n=1 Tax=unclassified Nocardioides TaxID=2615069 RepID=UPI0006FE62DB|nr:MULTISPECIES: MBL fold metallo-hydrolase [unclassified Nocardioides]KQY50240.1 MBL fold metallo-hydrolase [Nocardioides sp. Root140]KQZ75865.1 MBL fold metallo-hydrolase [Nocardioides sp. Root151]KRF14936.1 MBL fold metallo-hydrolase [Nocardioides sp. Soil796]